jgi:hypothetical protein
MCQTYTKPTLIELQASVWGDVIVNKLRYVRDRLLSQRCSVFFGRLGIYLNLRV